MQGNILFTAKSYWQLMRGFTMLAPFIGIVSAAVIAGSLLRVSYNRDIVLDILLVGLAAAVLNGASNVLNQYYDIGIDKVNGLKRPLAMGLILPRNALKFMFALFFAALVFAYLFSSNPIETAFIFALGFLAAVFYSVPPIRFKRFTWFSNLTISVARGLLLVLAGWSVLSSVSFSIEPWIIGSFFAICIFFLVSAKDLRDVKGDRKFGIKTLPVLYGGMSTKKFLSVGFFVPGPVILLLAGFNVLQADRSYLYFLALLALILAIILTLAIRKTNGTGEKTWLMSYLFLFFLQIGLGLVYFFS